MKPTYMSTREDALAARRWYVVDAMDQVVGRVASAIANLLRGKGKSSFTPHVDSGDFVVVVNAAQLSSQGRRGAQGLLSTHGLSRRDSLGVAGKVLTHTPERVLRHAVEGMLPKNRLGRQLARKLKIYAGRGPSARRATADGGLLIQERQWQNARSQYQATGKRKRAVARVWLIPGEGEIRVNTRLLDDYFGRPTSRMVVNQPFEMTETAGRFDVAGQRLRRRRVGTSRCGSPRHHPGAASSPTGSCVPP